MQTLQSVLSPSGSQAAVIVRLWWIMLVTCGVVAVAVLAFIAAAIYRNRDRRLDFKRPTETTLTAVVSGAVAITTLLLCGLLIASVWTDRVLVTLGATSAVSVSVVGHQWWWEVEYEDAVPARRFKTANEIHIPVGQPVVFKVTSRDVIHSLWVPTLQGKRDLIPGYTTAIWLQADRSGTFRGQCAEFCGLQHAHMALTVVAESEIEFERWADNQRAPASEPHADATIHGRGVFLTGSCATCHAVRGTAAYGSVGPDLTHLVSRRTIAAGTLPNSRGHLAGWILGSQAIKPGNAMPDMMLPADDLHDLLAYLETLK